MKILANSREYSRYGFVVSKRIGNAVVRNRTKRLLREIMRHIEVKPGYDIIFVTRAGISDLGFHELKSKVMGVLSQAGLVMENHEDSVISVN